MTGARRRRRLLGSGRRRTSLVVLGGVALLITSLTAAYASLADSASVTTSVVTGQLAAPTDVVVTQTCTPFPAVRFRSAATDSGSGSLTLPVPAGTAAGDVLVAQVANRNASTALVPPAGWTLIRRESSGTQVTSAVLYRVATSGEPAGYAFSVSGGSPQMAGGIAAFIGVDTTAPVADQDGATGYGTTVTTASVTTSRAGSMVLHAVTKRQEDLGAPGGTTERWRLMSGTGTATEGVSAGTEPVSAAGAVGARTVSSGAGFPSEWIAQTVALQPPAPLVTASLTWSASPSSWAQGYRLDRVVGGTVQSSRSLTPVTTTSADDGPLPASTTYTYRLQATYRNWTSAVVTGTLTPSC